MIQPLLGMCVVFYQAICGPVAEILNTREFERNSGVSAINPIYTKSTSCVLLRDQQKYENFDGFMKAVSRASGSIDRDA